MSFSWSNVNRAPFRTAPFDSAAFIIEYIERSSSPVAFSGVITPVKISTNNAVWASSSFVTPILKVESILYKTSTAQFMTFVVAL